MIKNRKELARTTAREQALAILEAGYDAIDTKSAIRRLVSVESSGALRIADERYEAGSFDRLFIIGIGKCAFDAAEALESILGTRIFDGVIIDVKGGVLKHLTSYVGSHPFPSPQNIFAAASAVEFVRQASEKDLVICVISGGGSALLCWPHILKCEELVRITEELFKSGATIQETNTVRKHLSDIQGGQLAKLAYPARLVSLIFSDVPGNALDMVASGPTVKDTTTVEDAAEILARYRILDTCQLPSCDLVETPKEDIYFENVKNILTVSNTLALQAMAESARQLGYDVVVKERGLDGEARQAAAALMAELASGKAVLAGGETTVAFGEKTGTGGRNQETVLAGVAHLKPHQVVISAASDGEDNGSHAGAIADDETKDRATAMDLNIEQTLDEHNTTPFFHALNDLIETGKTGSNVSDLFIALEARHDSSQEAHANEHF